MVEVTSLESRREEPSRRERQRLETRNRIYEAALAEFRSAGFARAQIETIVAAAGVARGTFYFHFPTKEHVLYELQRRQEREIVERLTAALRERPPSVRAFLDQVIDSILAQMGTVGDRGLTREVMAMYVREPRVFEVSANPLVVAVVDFFSEALERGDVRDDLSAEELALAFLASLFGLFLGAVDHVDEQRSAFAHAVDIFVRGIAP